VTDFVPDGCVYISETKSLVVSCVFGCCVFKATQRGVLDAVSAGYVVGGLEGCD